VTGGTPTFAFQVKSEKVKAADVRVEVDDSDFAKDQVRVNLDGHGDGRKKAMSDWLDPVFAMATTGKVKLDDKDYRQAAEAIRVWLDSDASKSPAIAKLKELLPKSEEDKIKHLRPILLGQSLRTRFHIYADGQPSKNPLLNNVPPSAISHDTVA